jgi:hypothetical protein
MPRMAEICLWLADEMDLAQRERRWSDGTAGAEPHSHNAAMA